MKTENIITCSGLCKSFGSTVALDNVNLSIGRGRIVGLLGPNGSGKTTLIKILNGLIRPTGGQALVSGMPPGPETKAIVSYLPDKSYFSDWMKTSDVLKMFSDFYTDFDMKKAESMCASLGIDMNARIKQMSKGTKEKMQLILVMSRNAELYLLDEPIAGVDPAARDFILSTIINNYNEEGTILISTHLISDIERILDEAVFIQSGRIIMHDTIDNIKETEGKSIDAVFRDRFRMMPQTEETGHWVYRSDEEVK